MGLDYNDNSISELNDLQHIVHRPSAYVPDTGFEGRFTITREIVDNSTDELELLSGGTLEVFLFIDRLHQDYEIVVRDTGRGIPIGKLIDSFSKTKVSGKFSTDSYQFSAGSLGYGSSVTLALSKWFRAISLNKKVIGDVTIHRNDIPKQVNTINNELGKTGTIVMFSPDEGILSEGSRYIETIGKLDEFLAHLSLFCKFRIKLFVIEQVIPESIKFAETIPTIEFLDQLSQSTLPAFDSVSLDRETYIKNYFGVQRNWHGRFPIEGANSNDTLRIKGEILVLLSSTPSSSNKLTFVNNILFTDNASFHIKNLHTFLKDKLVGKIKDKNIKKFFIDNYKLPIWLVLDVKYSGAVFSGMSKTSFKDHSIVDIYQKLLTEIIDQSMLDKFYEIIEEHISVMFNRFSNSDFKVSSLRHMSLKLNRPTKFNNCKTTNSDIAELFLVEGDSAKSDQDRDANFQAIYTIGGKPINALTSIDNLSESSNDLKKNKIFQDIIRILNITPGNNDLSKLNFKKIFITTDADTHGYHIASIITGNLYALCPALLEQGHVYLVKPPLYSLKVKGSSPIYVKDTEELNVMLAYHLYYKCLDIKITGPGVDRTLSREEFVAFSELIIKIGDVLERLSQEYMIPAILLEQLSLMTNHINVANPNIDELRKWLQYDIRYIESSNIIIVSIGMDDVIVPLTQITDLIYSKILPLYREFFYGKTRLYVTTKLSELYKESPITLIQLYHMFQQMGNIFKIERYKGLGSMPPEARNISCFSPETRRAYQITSLGDVDTIFDMLGDDPTPRKRLISI